MNNYLKKIVVGTFASLLMMSPMLEADAATTKKKAANVLNPTAAVKINKLLKSTNVQTAVSIRDAKTGKILYSYNPTKVMSTASNMKLLTAAASLKTLGENYRFTTKLHTTGTITKAGTLNGDVYLQGQGDPTFHKSDLTAFAKQLKAKGIKKINGTVYGDGTWFDQKYLAPGINKTDSLTYYGAPVSALSISPNGDYDTGVVVTYATGTTAGKKPKVTFSAKGHLQVVNQATTTKKGSSSSLSISRTYGTNKIVIKGTVAEGKVVSKWLSVDNPTKHTMTVFLDEIKKQGIKLSKTTYKLKATPKKTTLIKQDYSPKLSNILIPFMKLSNNGIADTLTKTMGQKVYKTGTNAAGIKAIRRYANTKNIPSSKWSFVDGSGLSSKDKVAPSTMTKFLYDVQKDTYYKTYMTSLPIGGNTARMVGGTLRHRFTTTALKNRVQAKTGSINGVRTLSGYVKQKDGDQVIVSILTANTNSTATIDALVNTIINEK